MLAIFLPFVKTGPGSIINGSLGSKTIYSRIKLHPHQVLHCSLSQIVTPIGHHISNHTWWGPDMEMLSTLLALCVWNPLVTGGFRSQGTCNMDLWCFLWCQPERAVEQTIKLPVIWEAMTLMWCRCYTILFPRNVTRVSSCTKLNTVKSATG